MAETAIETGNKAEKKSLSLRGAVFLGIGSMVGAGIFALFGEAGTIAGTAAWVSFLMGGIIALIATCGDFTVCLVYASDLSTDIHPPCGNHHPGQGGGGCLESHQQEGSKSHKSLA